MAQQDRVAIGLMSGTSMDGVDAAVLETDGVAVVRPGPSVSVPYAPEFRRRLRAAISGNGDVSRVERDLTRHHSDAVISLLSTAGCEARDVDVIGFHGHTIRHAPERRETVQIGDGPMLAGLSGIDVVHDFRGADVAAGGQGAPLAPVYHRAVLSGVPRPLAVLNIGGVANVTWIGPGDDDLIGFDTGPGNALIDDWVHARTGADCDVDGRLAAAGRADRDLVARCMATPYFARKPPKSLDRNAFSRRVTDLLAHMPLADGAATLTALTVDAVARARDHFPSLPDLWVVVGGGRLNHAMMDGLRSRLGCRVIPGEAAGVDGDALEAQAFAYMAVRSLRGLPISYPGVTGVPAAMTGGVLARTGERNRRTGTGIS